MGACYAVLSADTSTALLFVKVPGGFVQVTRCAGMLQLLHMGMSRHLYSRSILFAVRAWQGDTYVRDWDGCQFETLGLHNLVLMNTWRLLFLTCDVDSVHMFGQGDGNQS